MALCCDYDAGMLQTPVDFQRKIRASDGAGGFTETWHLLRCTRAFVKGLSGFERLQNDRVNAETKERIVVRYFPGLKPEDRISMDGRVHNITYINDIERKHRWLSIDLSGGVAT